MLKIFKKEPFSSQDLADQAQRILSGQCEKWDVDDYESCDPKNPKLRDLRAQTLSCGLPEEWIELDDAQKTRLQAIIEQMREVKVDS